MEARLTAEVIMGEGLSLSPGSIVRGSLAIDMLRHGYASPVRETDLGETAVKEVRKETATASRVRRKK